MGSYRACIGLLLGIHGILLSIHGLLLSIHGLKQMRSLSPCYSPAGVCVYVCVCVCVCVCGHLCRMSPTLAFPSTHSIPCRSSRVANRSCANLIDGHRQGCFPCSAYGFCMHTQLTQTRVGECCGEDRRGHYLVRIC